MIAMIGTSDRLCWLAETCKILLLLRQNTSHCAKLIVEEDPRSTKTRCTSTQILRLTPSIVTCILSEAANKCRIFTQTPTPQTVCMHPETAAWLDDFTDNDEVSYNSWFVQDVHT